MAAPPLREAYDCVVIGGGNSAHLLTAAFSQAGLSSLHLLRETTQPPAAWLHPRLLNVGNDEQPRRTALAGVQVLDTSGRLLASLTASAAGAAGEQSAANLPSCQHERASLGTTTVFQLPSSCDVSASECDKLELCGTRWRHSIQTRAVINLVPAHSEQAWTAIGGLYRGVTFLPGEERQGLLFATYRGCEVFWLMPGQNGLTSLGWLRPSPVGTNIDSLAGSMEEALVACPALTQRLIAAQLVGNWHQTHEEPAIGGTPNHWLTLAASESWIDPVFSGGHWLLESFLPQIVSLVSSVCISVRDQRSATQQLQFEWLQAARLLRARTNCWYHPTDATADLVTREIFAQLLASDSHHGPTTGLLPASSFSWEARGILAPRRALLSL
ncbi:hypothetical protein [Anatilimnocola aggregata]|nr:hypothetical protein [Anatilimnocola aggregata]